MNQRHHIRTGSQGRKPPSAHITRPGKEKPPAIRRGLSYNNPAQSQSQLQPQHHNHSQRPCTASRKLAGVEEQKLLKDEDSDMSSFPQFCATCEKQIITPGNSILYCSEACRRGDISSPYLFDTPHSPSMLPSPSTPYECPPHDIIPQRSPTVLPPLSLAFSDFPISNNAPSEADEPPSPISRRESSETGPWNRFEADASVTHFSAARKSHVPRSSIAIDSGHLPSLVHSPSSSYGTVGSCTSYRPMLPRHGNPFSASFSATKSIDLVLPQSTNSSNTSDPTSWLKDSSLKSSASTITSFRVAEAGELSYNRHSLQETPRQGSLEHWTVDGSSKPSFDYESGKALSTNR